MPEFTFAGDGKDLKWFRCSSSPVSRPKHLEALRMIDQGGVRADGAKDRRSFALAISAGRRWCLQVEHARKFAVG